MSVALLVMTDGRDDCLGEAIGSAHATLTAPGVCAAAPRGRFDHLVIHDDTGNPAHRAELAERFPQFTVIGSDRAGFGGAIRNAWRFLRAAPDVEWIFWLEDDFRITRPVDLPALMRVMDGFPYLAQIALERQPWNDIERAAGGILEQHPDSWESVAIGATGRGDAHIWREHRRFFTTNPCLIRRSLLDREWPEGSESEGRFGIDLFAEDPQTRCAFWGAQGEQWCEHIGHERVGTGY